MRITEKRLRRVISKVINEMSHMMPHMDKAIACCSMPVASLFDMCSQICSSNESMSSHCAELCVCACRGDKDGCCRCLDRICSCPKCAQICSDCCDLAVGE